MVDPHPLTLDALVAMLAPAVGEEKAREAIADAARVLGTARPDRVLEALAAEDGVLGVAARFVKMRAARREAEESWQAAARTVEASDLAELLAPSLGEEKSREVVLAALQRAELPAQGLDQARALALLELLAVEPGIVGVTARFAKARLILLFPR